MSTFGHQFQFQNPAFDDSESSTDPAQTTAGKVLEERKLKQGKTVTKVSLLFKLALLLVFAIGVIALVFSLMFYTGKVTPDSETSTAEKPVGFELSNQQLYDAIAELKKQVKQLQNANKTTRNIIVIETTRLQKNINVSIDQAKSDNVDLQNTLQQAINGSIDQAKSDNVDLQSTLQQAINGSIDQAKSDNIDLQNTLQQAINGFIDQAKSDKVDLQNTLQQAINGSIDQAKTDNDNLQSTLQQAINGSIDQAKNDNDNLQSTLQQAINGSIDQAKSDNANLQNTLQNNINDTIDKCMTVNSTLVEMINTVSKMEGPVGPAGAGNVSQCIVNIQETSLLSVNSSSKATVAVVESVNKKILHFSCSSNIADSVQQKNGISLGGLKEYGCECTGKGNFDNPVPTDMYCYLTYTECPLIT